MDRKIEILKAFGAVCLCCSRSKDDYPMKELDLIADVLAEAQEKQATSDKTSDKYRWHDLRKDPNDLPKEDMDVLAVRDCMGLYKQTPTNFANGVWFDCLFNEIAYDVIAWREVEPFEGDDDE